ncbi:MAG: pyridoxal 5'-phosphate synthase [Pseudomonadota bacterium]
MATVDSAGHPSTRVVLLKGFGYRGLLFSTSEESNKGKDLAQNPWAACTLWWRETVQQIHCQGRVHKLSEAESDEMFKERIAAAQAIASISKQSSPMEDENLLRTQVNDLIVMQIEIQRRKSWHGYVLELTSIEFWHGSADRFHKRLRYDLVNGNWNHLRLQP